MDPAPEVDRRLTGQERWIFFAFLLGLVGLFTAEVVSNYEPRKLTALVFFMAWYPLIALHEAGHAITAHALGWKVGQIVVGMGRRVATFRIGGAYVEMRAMPFSGSVSCVPGNLVRPRLKDALIYAAGPGIELILVLSIVFVVGPDVLLEASENYGVILAQGIAAAAATGAVTNLIPRLSLSSGRLVASDGLGILQSFGRPDAYYAELVGSTFNPDDNTWEAYEEADWWKRK